MTSEVLHQALADGRLEFPEFSRRLDLAQAAQSRDELAALTDDLAGREEVRQLGFGARISRVALRGAWFGWVIVVVISLVLWPMMNILTGDPVSFWPAYITIPWLLLLLLWTFVSMGFTRRD